MKIEEKSKFLKAGKKISLVAVFGVFAVVAILMMFQVGDVVVEQLTGERAWSPIALADGDPGGDVSGFMYFMAYPHQGVPATAYAANLTNATAYEFSDSLDAEMTGDTPYDTTFDFVMKFRVNDTVGYNVSGSCWEDSWVRANITCDFDYATDIAADTVMTIVQIANSADFAWYHAYIQDYNGDVGSGFTITHNEKYNVTSVTADGYYVP